MLFVTFRERKGDCFRRMFSIEEWLSSVSEEEEIEPGAKSQTRLWDLYRYIKMLFTQRQISGGYLPQ